MQSIKNNKSQITSDRFEHTVKKNAKYILFSFHLDHSVFIRKLSKNIVVTICSWEISRDKFVPFVQVVNEKSGSCPQVNFQPVGGLQHAESVKGKEQQEPEWARRREMQK